MKKIVIALVVVVLLMAGLVLIPNQQQHIEKVLVNCTPTGATRVVSDFGRWKKWWPGEIKNDTIFSFRNQPFKIQTLLLNGFYAEMKANGIPTFIDLQFLSAPNKQSEFNYSYTFYYSANPLIKLSQLIKSHNAKKELRALINEIKANLEDTIKVYGYEISEERVPNAIHISSKRVFNHAPSTEDIYTLVEALEKYIATNQAKAVNAPIYNIFSPDDVHFQLMVAIATDRPLPSKNSFLFKEMVRGKIIIGKAIGDNSKTADCMKQVEYFVKDYGRSSPAIQFNRLVTDRRIEKDSTRWVTTINYPVFDRSFF